MGDCIVGVVPDSGVVMLRRLMSTTPQDEAPISSENALFEVFQSAFRTEARLVGIEAEKFGIFDDNTPLHYLDSPKHPGVETLFRSLSKKFGWQPEAEKPGGPALSLVRDKACITLEPGSQFELSGSALPDVHQVWAEVDGHRKELAALTDVPGIHWVAMGFAPFARQEDLDWVPKSRYPVMKKYFPTVGTRGLDMMRRTATVQANFDFTSERDAMRKLRVALAASVIATGLFASSPLYEGKQSGHKTYRGHVWLDTDNTRAGLLPFAWKADASLNDYVQWALDVPMFIIKRDGEAFDATAYTFRRFMREGIQGHRATIADWESHLKTMFPEARLQRTLEVRGADTVPAYMSMALPAMWLAILYDEHVLRFAEERLVSLGYEAWADARKRVIHEGLGATIGSTTVGALARDLLAECDTALARRNRLDTHGNDERQYLTCLREAAASNRSLGDLFLDGWDGTPASLFTRAAY
jgi:glutamate--cysteine ligase